MTGTVTVRLPEDMGKELEIAAKEDKISSSGMPSSVIWR